MPSRIFKLQKFNGQSVADGPEAPSWQIASKLEKIGQTLAETSQFNDF